MRQSGRCNHEGKPKRRGIAGFEGPCGWPGGGLTKLEKARKSLLETPKRTEPCSNKKMNFCYIKPFSSVQLSRSVVSDSLQPHGLQHATPPCPSPTPGVAQTHVHSVGDAIQPSHPLSSPSPALSLFPASGSFQMSQLFASGGQSIGVSASASVLPMNSQD